MKRYLKLTTKPMICLAALAAFALASQATPINIKDADDGSPADAGDAAVAAWLAAVVADYNLDTPASLPAPGALSFKQNINGTTPQTVGTLPPDYATEYPTFGAGTTSITLPVDDYDYLVLHWGGSGGGTWQAFYIGNAIAGSEETAIFNAPGRNGLSSYAYYGPRTHVPDGGATLALLGFAVCITEAMRRRMFKG